MSLQRYIHKKTRTGLTLPEVIVVLAVIMLVAFLVVPLRSRAAEDRLRSAASLVVSDLEYIKNLAINGQEYYSMIFGNDGKSFMYKVCNSEGVIEHPLRAGLAFEVRFDQSRRLRQIMTRADFDSRSAITFDYLGSPYSGTGTHTPLTNGTIFMQAGKLELEVFVEPVTGYISIR
jgi:Tfp pilus assembly protein FimT